MNVESMLKCHFFPKILEGRSACGCANTKWDIYKNKIVSEPESFIALERKKQCQLCLPVAKYALALEDKNGK